jgi:tRNA pseudouridine38-40 synthase
VRNIYLVLSYDGSSYNGFQCQPFKNTVQDKLQEAIFMLTGDHTDVEGSGRTDAGVHARGQVVNFKTSSDIPIERWRMAINSRLPRDIVIQEAREVPLSFHARRSAKRKTYRYTISNTRVPDVFRRLYQYHHPTPLNAAAMELALQYIIGEHDFSSFCSRRSTKQSHVRTIYQAYLEREIAPDNPIDPLDGRSGVMHLYITGNGFLYNMVRVIAGTLIQVGEGKRMANDMERLLDAKDRLRAGPTAMAHGLTLWDVEYDLSSIE